MFSSLAYFLNLNIGAICSSETLIVLQRNTESYIPEDRTINKLLDLEM
jgi:hypothetical protein